MPYAFDEVLPYLYSNLDDSPQLKEGLFKDSQVEDEFWEEMFDFLNSPLTGEYSLSLEEFTSQHDKTGETKTFPAHTFNFQVTKSKKVLDESYEGKTWYHYENHLTDVDSGQKYVLYAHYYQPTGDMTSICIEKVKEKKASVATVFVLVGRQPEGLRGIFKSLNKALKSGIDLANESDHYHIEEVPMDSVLALSKDDKGTTTIKGALKRFDLQGREL